MATRWPIEPTAVRMQAASGEAVALDEDAARGCVYRLLARFLVAPPDAEALAVAAALEGGDSDLGRAMSALARVARATVPIQARDEFDRLFLGLVRGELVPYASFYRTGFLYDRPLAAVRADLSLLGVARIAASSEPEDHIAGLCELMAGLIGGEYGAGSLDQQQQFFDRHLAPWAARFFADMERARGSRLYGPLGTLGRVFMDIEASAFALAA